MKSSPKEEQASLLRQLKAKGRTKGRTVFRLNGVAYKLIRITNLLRTQEVMELRSPAKG